MFITGLITGYLLGILTIACRDLRDLKLRTRRTYNKVADKTPGLPNISSENVIKVTPEDIRKQEKKEVADILYK